MSLLYDSNHATFRKRKSERHKADQWLRGTEEGESEEAEHRQPKEQRMMPWMLLQ